MHPLTNIDGVQMNPLHPFWRRPWFTFAGTRKEIKLEKNIFDLPDNGPYDGTFCIRLKLDKCKGFHLVNLAPRISRRARIEPYEAIPRHLETSHKFLGC